MATATSDLQRTFSYPLDMPIPNRFNALLALTVFAGAISLLWWGSHVQSHWAVLGVGVLFGHLLLTNYALLHESAHDNLHSKPVLNRLLGTLCGLLFPCPYSMMHAMHQGHHLRNRTDYEMFDLYYASDSRLIRFIQWYGILCGFFWPWVPIGAVLFSLCPSLLRTRVFKKARSSSYLLGDVRVEEVRAIRRETALNVVFFAALFWLLDLKVLNTLALYACFAFNWSTRQYIGHAFTRRDVVEGAYNLKASRWTSWLLLHGELDLSHHRRPDVSWYYLPRLAATDEPAPAYWRQYLRLWSGPRLNMEPAPETLRDMPLSIHR